MEGYSCNFVTSLKVTRCMYLYHCQPQDYELLTKKKMIIDSDLNSTVRCTAYLFCKEVDT